MSSLNISIDKESDDNDKIDTLIRDPDEIWENDKGKPEIDNKINEMFNLYFLKQSMPNSLKSKDKGHFLHIDFVKFHNIMSSPNQLDVKIDKSDTSKDRFRDIYRNIQEANIYDKNHKHEERSDVDKNILFSCLILGIGFYISLIFWPNTIIITPLIYIFGIILHLVYLSHKSYLLNFKELNNENLTKLYTILNARPNLDLYYDKELIISIPFHSYADISAIQYDHNKGVTLEKINCNKFTIINFPLNFIYFIDSTQQYFKFLIAQFNKYCYIRNFGSFNNIHKKMYIKFSLKTKDNEIIYKNDSFFYTTFATYTPCCYKLFLYISVIFLFSPILLIIIGFFKYRIHHIKKVVSIKHNLEEYINLDTLFLKIIKKGKQIKREKHEVISERKLIQQKFIQECVDLTNKIKNELKEVKESGNKNIVPSIVLNLEIKGYLTPFSYICGFYLQYTIDFEELFVEYGRKIEKIFGKKFLKVLYPLKRNTNYEDVEDDEGDDENDNINTNENSNKKEMDDSPIREVIYTEKVLKLRCKVSKDEVKIFYTINLETGHKKEGNFILRKRLSGGFANVEEKVNDDWTKSEIYLPGLNDIIEIVRKKRAIRLSGGNFTLTIDTQLNSDLHGGAPSWIDGKSWDNMEKYVKNCNKSSRVNRFKIEH